jgi:fumarate reductase subunit D
MDTDNHGIKCIARYPYPMFLGAFEELGQMRLEPILTGIFTIDAVIAFLQGEKVVMDIGNQVIEQVAQTFVLWMVAYLIFIGSHRMSISYYLTRFQVKNPMETDFPPLSKDRGLQPEE